MRPGSVRKELLYLTKAVSRFTRFTRRSHLRLAKGEQFARERARPKLSDKRSISALNVGACPVAPGVLMVSCRKFQPPLVLPRSKISTESLRTGRRLRCVIS